MSIRLILHESYTHPTSVVYSWWMPPGCLQGWLIGEGSGQGCLWAFVCKYARKSILLFFRFLNCSTFADMIFRL